MLSKKLKPLRKVIALCMMIFVFSGAVPAQAAFWGLSGDLFSHDPTIIKEGSLWWSPYTGQGIQMKYSSDGYTWHNGVQVFASELSWWKTYAPNMTTNDVWAPDLTYYNGTYYMFYSVSEFGKNNSAIGLVTCTSIAKGDWVDRGVIISSKSGTDSYNAIDPNLTIDANGKPWLVFGSWFDGIHVVRLNSSTWKPSGTVYTIAYKSGGIEGASMIYKDGYYYLFCSYGVCCNGVNSTYKIGYGRSTSITGGFVDQSGVSMTSGGVTYLDTGNTQWVGPGGQDVYKNGSNYLLVRHAYDATNNGMATLLISDLYFTNGWPTY